MEEEFKSHEEDDEGSNQRAMTEQNNMSLVVTCKGKRHVFTVYDALIASAMVNGGDLESESQPAASLQQSQVLERLAKLGTSEESLDTKDIKDAEDILKLKHYLLPEPTRANEEVRKKIQFEGDFTVNSQFLLPPFERHRHFSPRDVLDFAKVMRANYARMRESPVNGTSNEANLNIDAYAMLGDHVYRIRVPFDKNAYKPFYVSDYGAVTEYFKEMTLVTESQWFEHATWFQKFTEFVKENMDKFKGVTSFSQELRVFAYRHSLNDDAKKALKTCFEDEATYETLIRRTDCLHLLSTNAETFKKSPTGKEIKERFESDWAKVGKVVVMAKVLTAVKEGREEYLLRPSIAFGKQMHGETYPTLHDAIANRAPSNLRTLSRTVRAILQASNSVNASTDPPLSVLLGAWYYGEGARNPCSPLCTTMLLDLIEHPFTDDPISLKTADYGVISWKSVIGHPNTEGPWSDFCGAKVPKAINLLGLHPMVHAGSTISDSRKLGKNGVETLVNELSESKTGELFHPNRVQQKQGVVILLWLVHVIKGLGIKDLDAHFVDKEIARVDETLASIRKQFKSRRGESDDKFHVLDQLLLPLMHARMTSFDKLSTPRFESFLKRIAICFATQSSLYRIVEPQAGEAEVFPWVEMYTRIAIPFAKILIAERESLRTIEMLHQNLTQHAKAFMNAYLSHPGVSVLSKMAMTARWADVLSVRRREKNSAMWARLKIFTGYMLNELGVLIKPSLPENCLLTFLIREPIRLYPSSSTELTLKLVSTEDGHLPFFSTALKLSESESAEGVTYLIWNKSVHKCVCDE